MNPETVKAEVAEEVETPQVEAQEPEQEVEQEAEQPDAQAAFEEGLAEAEEEAEPEQEAAEAAEAEQPVEQPADPVADEIAALKLSERSAKRFRELAEDVKALAPIREMAEKEGFKLDELPQVFARAKERDEFVEMVSTTGASPEQFGKSLDYLRDIHAAASGDMKAAERAFELLLPEVQALAGLLGRDVQGVADPLGEHEDLREDVENGDLSRERALEIARVRNRDRIESGRREQQDQTQQAQVEREQGVSWLNQFERHMAANDPAYAAKREALVAFVEVLGAELPPSKWAQAVQDYYPRIPVPAPRPAPGPMRAGRAPASMTPEKFDSPMAAFEHGLANAG